MFCDKCKRIGPDETLTSYPVHYGKTLGTRYTSVQRVGNQVRSTKETSYEICGHTSVTLCADCVRRQRLRWGAAGVILAVGGIAMMPALNDALALPGLIIAIVGAGIFLNSLLRGYPAHMAVSIVRSDLRKRFGYDKFWTDKDFAALQRQQQQHGTGARSAVPGVPGRRPDVVATCFLCKTRVTVPAVTKRAVCTGCGAIGRWFLCTGCHKTCGIWSRTDDAVWSFTCPLCGTKQRHRPVASAAQRTGHAVAH